MKTRFLMLVMVILGLNFNVSAQERELTEEQKAEIVAQNEEDMKNLNLSETQKEAYDDITMKYALEMKELKEGKKSRREKYQAYKSIRDSKNSEMKALLDKDQYKTYLEIQERRKAEMKERRKS